jgi:hypothetical protein
MSNDPKPTPAVPQLRTKKLSKKAVIWLIALFGIMAIFFLSGIVAGAIGYMDGYAGRKMGEVPGPWIFMAFTMLAMVVTLWWSITYWKAIDEMAKRAHLDAFYWGATISWMLFLPIISICWVFPEFKFAMIETLSMSATQNFALGVASTVSVTCIGYGVVWLVWWAIKR